MSNVEQSTQFASESIKPNLQQNDATPTTSSATTTATNAPINITNSTASNNNNNTNINTSVSLNPNNVAPTTTTPTTTTSTTNASEINNKGNSGSNHNNITPPITTASKTTSPTETITTNIATTTAISIPTTIANTSPTPNLSSVTPTPSTTANTIKTTTITDTSSTILSQQVTTPITTNIETNNAPSLTTTSAINAAPTPTVNQNNKGSRNKSKDNNNNSDNAGTAGPTNNTNNLSGNANPLADGTSLMQSQQPSTTLFASSQAASQPAVVPNTTPPAPKPKTTRPRKTANNKSNTPPAPKAEPKRPRAKSAKAMAAATATAAAGGSAENSAPLPGTASVPNDKTTKSTQPQADAPPATKKRKSRSTSNDSNNPTIPPQPPPQAAASLAAAVSTAVKTPPARRPRKKKGEQVVKPGDKSTTSLVTNNPANIPLNVANPQLLSVAPNIPIGLNPNLNAHHHHQPQQQHHHQQQQPQQPTHANSRLMPGISPLDNQDATNRYFSLTISPYANYDYTNAASLTRPSLSRLFTSSSSSAADNNRGNAYSDELAKAFDELRENTWSQLSKCILDEAQQFDIPSLLGTLYTLRDENAKLVNKVKDLTTRREQMLNMNLRLELPGPALVNHLNATSPNYSSIMSRLTISPKNLPNSSPSPATKSPFSGSSYNHVPPGGLLGPPSFLDRSSPLVSAQTPHSGVNSLKSSSISTPSPPIGALMAHGVNNRAGLMTVGNPPYMSNVHPSINSSNPLGANPPSSSYYPRQ